MPVHYPSSFNNTQYLGGGGIRLTSWRQAIVPQNTPPYGLNYDFHIGLSSYLVKNSGGAIYSAYIINKNSSNRFLQFFNTITTPTSGSTPAFSFVLSGGSVASPTELVFGTDFFGFNGIAFTSGIAWGISTSESVFYPTLTPSDHTIQINYA